MNLKYFYIIFICVFVCQTSIFAQADINMSTNIFNRANYNPASISRPDYLYIFGSNKTQWIGVEGAPKVLNFQFSDYYQPLHSAFGFSFANDVIGFTSYLNPMLIYSYKITNDENWGLSFGIAGGIFSRSFDRSLIKSTSDNDPTVLNLPENILMPDANLGIEFQTNNLSIGISSTHILSLNSGMENLFLNSNHQYVYAVYEFKPNNSFHYSFGLQVSNRNYLTVVEGTSLLKFLSPTGLRNNSSKEVFDLGFTYRTSNIVTLMIGFYVLPDMRVGYAYDQSFNPNYSTNTTHEIMLEYRIPMKSAHPCGNCNNLSNNR